MASKEGKGKAVTDFSFVKNEIEELNKFRTLKEPPEIDKWAAENWKNPHLSKYKLWQPIPFAKTATDALSKGLPPYYTRTELPKPVNVSPLIRLARWSALAVGIVYGWTKFNRLREEESVIRLHNFHVKCRRNRAELEESWERSCNEMLDLASQLAMPVPSDFEEQMLATKHTRLDALKKNLKAWSVDLKCKLPEDFDSLMEQDYAVKPTDKQWHSMPSYPKGTIKPI